MHATQVEMGSSSRSTLLQNDDGAIDNYDTLTSRDGKIGP